MRDCGLEMSIVYVILPEASGYRRAVFGLGISKHQLSVDLSVEAKHTPQLEYVGLCDHNNGCLSRDLDMRLF